MKVYVTRIGVVSAIGINADENFFSLRSGRTGISRSAQHGIMLGEVKLSNEAIMEMLDLPDEDYSRTTLLGLLAAKEAWGESRISELIRTGLISSTSVGGVDRMQEYYLESLNDPTSNAKELLTHDNGRTTERIAKELGISGYIGTISTACSSGANAIMQGARMIEGNRLDRVVVGGSDPLAQFNIKGFSSLMIYNQEICKPFDDTGKGLNLGEGAGYLLLENELSLSKTGNIPLCRLAGWNNASDAYHQTSSSPDGLGAALAMSNALAKAQISPEKISYINAHGTGTANNDASESMALKKVFGDQVPPFSSTKGYTGHTLAAAGAVEAVYCIQAIQARSILPNLNFLTRMKDQGLIPETSFKQDMNLEYVLSNSFGFGGNCTSLIFAKA
jgi:3-oxoacyl-(acyl-carrier-protein) synthase